MAKKFKCHYCKEEDVLENLICKSINSDKQFKFHESCYEKYINTKQKKEIEKIKKQIEYEEFCKLYEYFKIEILGYKKDMLLSNYTRNRLQALRLGKSKVFRNEKIQGESYSYNIILTAFKVKKLEILNAIKGKTFDNEDRKVDYIIAIMSSAINDVYKRYLNAKRANKTFENIDVNTTDKKIDYKNNNINNDKVASLLNDLF